MERDDDAAGMPTTASLSLTGGIEGGGDCSESVCTTASATEHPSQGGAGHSAARAS